MTHATHTSWCGRPALIAVLSGLALASGSDALPAAARYFVRGDSNVDGRVNISDPIHLLNLLFVGNVDPLSCADAADEDDNGVLNITDAVVTLGYLFLGMAGPPPPAGKCGLDPTEDDLDCEAFARCEQPSDLVEERWVKRYDGNIESDDEGRAIALDENGNVIVTGGVRRSGTALDYATIKYDPAGMRLWIAFYDGPGSADDSARDVAIDSQGNVYVTGGSEGPGRRALTTVKYSPAGKELWAKRYEGPAGEDDFGQAIAIDEDGNVHVTGRSGVTSTDSDYITLKYSPSGEELWTPARYDGPAKGDDEAVAIAVDGSGNVYVTGRSESAETGYDIATVKYGANGQELWVARHDGSAHAGDAAAAIAVDGDGNILVAGSTEGSESGLDYTILKYAPAKTEIWTRRFDGPLKGDDQATALAVDAAGNVHVTGRIDHFFLCTEEDRLDDKAHPGDYGTVKYDAAGNLLWLARYEGADRFSSAFARAIALDGDGNVYVTGADDHFFECDIELEPTEDDYATLKYSPQGEELWLAIYDGPEDLDDGAADIAVDAQGDVYVTGRAGSTLFNGGGDIATIRYTPR